MIRGGGGAIVWTTREPVTGMAQPQLSFGVSATHFALSRDSGVDGVDDYAVWRPNATTDLSIFTFRPSPAPATPVSVNVGQSGDYPVGNSRSHERRASERPTVCSAVRIRS